MNKSGLVASAGALLITSFVAQGSPRTGGDNPSYTNTLTGVTNNVVVDWKDTRGGQADNGPDYFGATTTRYEQPESIRGDNKLSE